MSDPQQVAAELTRAVNRASAENDSNTPDYVLGEFLASVLEAFNTAVRARDEHGSYWFVCGTMRSAERLAEMECLDVSAEDGDDNE